MRGQNLDQDDADNMRPLPVHVEDGGEVLRVLVKEVLRDLAWHELLAELEHLVIIIVIVTIIALVPCPHCSPS